MQHNQKVNPNPNQNEKKQQMFDQNLANFALQSQCPKFCHFQHEYGSMLCMCSQGCTSKVCFALIKGIEQWLDNHLGDQTTETMKTYLVATGSFEPIHTILIRKQWNHRWFRPSLQSCTRCKSILESCIAPLKTKKTKQILRQIPTILNHLFSNRLNRTQYYAFSPGYIGTSFF